MLVSNALPMLAAVSSGSTASSCSWSRQERRSPLWAGRGLKRGYSPTQTSGLLDAERRAMKRAERVELAGLLDFDDEAAFAAYLDRLRAEIADGQVVADDDSWEAVRADEDLDDDLLDSFGVSTYAELAVEVGAEVVRMGETDDRFDLDECDLPGWGAARVDFAEFSTGFHVEAGFSRRYRTTAA